MENLRKQIAELREEIEKIKTRNKRVEADKAWELSRTRTIFIAISTYTLILIFMLLIKDNHPFLNALIAASGYLISQETYGILKKWWLKGKVSK